VSAHVSDEQLSLLADGELSLVARAAVLDHIGTCPSCAERHDALIDLVATLRLEPRLEWSAAGTSAVLDRRREMAGKPDRALPLAAVLAAVAIVLAALSLPLIEAGARVGLRLSTTAATVISHQLGLSIVVVAVVALLSAIAAVVTLPLTRWR
jgi:anti-sigma factor RsiW